MPDHVRRPQAAHRKTRTVQRQDRAIRLDARTEIGIARDHIRGERVLIKAAHIHGTADLRRACQPEKCRHRFNVCSSEISPLVGAWRNLAAVVGCGKDQAVKAGEHVHAEFISDVVTLDKGQRGQLWRLW